MNLPIEIADAAGLQEVLGYLNFSAGASDPKFLRNLNALWGAIEASGSSLDESWREAQRLLGKKLEELSSSSPAFRDADQARSVLRLVFDEALPAYRNHHRDLLFHQTDAELLRPFFVGRVAEAILSEGGPWEETERIVAGMLARINDFLGHRPVAVLETHKHEPYAHERVRPVPLFIAGAGVSVGKYHDLVEQTLAILRGTDRQLLEAANFDPELLDELAFDPRAYDFNHPVNRRPNYHFGQWDPHVIDNKGRYRRFVVQQCTLDAVLARVENTTDIPREQLLFEAGAVLAGTILMAAGTSGNGPETHDSTVSLATLLPRIAKYRDDFYQQLFAKPGGQHRQRLEAEAAARRQPFAGARQHLNGELARLRALQLQHTALALLFARLGFSDAAMRQAQIVPAASARMVCQMQCLLTAGHREADAGRLAEAFAVLPEVEDLLHRAIQCGAVMDPWNILAFGGQFSLFPAVENSIPDPRVDELLDLIEQLFALYARLWHEAATAENSDLQKRLPMAFRKRAEWWDKFATTSVSGFKEISGQEAFEAAARVASAVAAWNKAGEAAGSVAFWRPHAEEFDSPQAYGRVIEVLLDKPDLPAAMALLMHWLCEAVNVRLDEGARSFYALAVRWLQAAISREAPVADAPGSPKIIPQSPFPTPHSDSLIAKFFDYLEANAGIYWEVPEWQSGEIANGDNHSRRMEAAASASDDDTEIEDEDDEDLFGAAYENMVYRDSTADDIDADMLEVPGAGSDSNNELDREQQRLSRRLAFLAMLASLWKLAAQAVGAPAEWLTQATANRQQLLKLAAMIGRQPIPASSANYDALLDYDRRRLVRETILEKIIATIVANFDAELLLAATLGESRELIAQSEPVSSAGPETIAIWSAVLRGDAASIQRHWGMFLAEIARQPLLYVPLARGGDARRIASARGVQQSIRELLGRLPRLGMLRETCQLLRVARAMEKDHPQGAGAVTEFDRLFEIGFKSIVESLVESSLSWGGTQESGVRHQESVANIPHSPFPNPHSDSPLHNSDPAIDAQLIDCLQQVTESLLSEWLTHSRTLRLSVLERVVSPKAWQDLVKFIERYGHDLFTQQFFHLGNLRAILHQGIDVWLERLAEDEETAEQLLLVRELDHGLSRAEAKRHLSLVIEAIVENYAEYRDYNATTTQSDRGEMLYTLLDFLRVKVGYERIHWNLRPVMMAHEVLVRRGANGAAELWRRAMAERTADAADQQLKRLGDLQTQYAMRLPTIADRLSERFVRPLAIDRVRALVGPSAEEARSGSPPAAFSLLEQEAGELAQEPCGAGLDLPDWLEGLEDEVDLVSAGARSWNPSTDAVNNLPWVRLTWDEIQSQLTDWDTPPEVSK
jgi:hypothetical protein